MKKILKLSAIALLATSTSLMAQMTGPSVAISASHLKASTDGTADGNNNNTSGTVSRNFNIASIDLDYSSKIDNSWLASVGINYIPFKGKIGDESRVDTDVRADLGGNTTGTSTAKGELKNHITVYVEPTYLINPTSGIYAKLGYMHADLQITDSVITGSSLNQRIGVHGIQYGLGYKAAVDKNVYVKVEYTVSDYSSISATSNSGNTFTANPEIKAGTISVGYTF